MTALAGIFSASSTAEDVLQGLDLRGKRILVTGVSAGIGVETTRALLTHGAEVVGAVRDLEKPVPRRHVSRLLREEAWSLWSLIWLH